MKAGKRAWSYRRVEISREKKKVEMKIRNNVRIRKVEGTTSGRIVSYQDGNHLYNSST